MKNMLQKIVALSLALVLILMPLGSVTTVSAQEAQTETSETQESAPPLESLPPLENTSPPQEPSAPDPNSVSEPTVPSEPQGGETQTQTSSSPTIAPLLSVSEDEYFGNVPAAEDPATEVQNATAGVGESSNGQTGGASLETGDATSTTGISNTGNTNTAGVSASGSGGATAKNTGNGAHSTNDTQSTTTNTSDTDQQNSAVIDNELNSATVTGKNATSFNTGDSSLTTGDANTTGTLFNNVNSNLAGVSVSEFNIADDYNGDYVLDFAANCILGCEGTGLTHLANTGNGAFSDNSVDSNTTNNTIVDQTNDGVLINNLNLLANSGDNTASFNTGGDSNITTGDANVSANVINFMNTNASGNVLLGVVNIFGDLVGDILLPEGFGTSGCTNCGNSGTFFANADNGAFSDNNVHSETTNNSETFQNNDAVIDNNLILSANTGDNKTSFNTNGNSSVKTGETDVHAQLLNIANMNISGGDWFLVIVNRAGQWVGQILGAPEGATFAGTEGTEFAVDENGQIMATNSGNGAQSENNVSSQTTHNSTVNQDNNAQIVNNITLDANTGNNSSSYNTGGGSDITTGDATVIANLVNFVNTNISGGRLVVTVVNVFGNWLGDFVTPGQEQRQKTSETHELASTSPSEGRGGTQESSNDSGQSENANTNQDDTRGEEVLSNETTGVGSLRDTSDGTSVTTGNGSSQAFVRSQGEQNEVSVLGESAHASDTIQKAIRINLAWLILLLPALLVLATGGFIFRRKLLSHRI